ncbi:MAG: hypothetical protein HW419_3371, partial [Deltaproteobacteria bacterium]|nr:hypothetical protein [Deltaproteobacteria bacterium]
MGLGTERIRLSAFRIPPLACATARAILFCFLSSLVITTQAIAVDRIRIAVSNPNMPNLTTQMALKR